MQIEAVTAIETVNRILNTNPGSRQNETGAAARRVSSSVETRVKADSDRADHGTQVHAVNEIQKELKQFDISLKFSRDTDTGSTVVELVNDQTGETLRQIPSEASLHLASVLGKLQGKIFNRKA